jgi:3-deoxy-manno-octulosonate cytidylyltransferase (CMP-KDO synthetase)
VFRVVIPARYGSTRFPGKALAMLHGQSMLQWVYRRAAAAGAAQVVIATDDERIATVARAFGADVAMTAVSHASGTDRVAEVCRQRDWGSSSIVVNVQGDEPGMPPALIGQVATLLNDDPQAAIATLASAIERREDFLDPRIVKVVTDSGGRALFFSRAPIPWSRDTAREGLPSQTAWPLARRHVGLYAYRVSALLQLARWAPTPLEDIEKLEQLRALEHGLLIRVADASVAPGVDVNTPDDLLRAQDSFDAAAAAGR